MKKLLILVLVIAVIAVFIIYLSGYLCPALDNMIGGKNMCPNILVEIRDSIF